MDNVLKEDDEYKGLFWFYCPGCKCRHIIWTKECTAYTHASWTYNGDLVKPTFSPSLLIKVPNHPNKAKRLCHSFIRDGNIQFLNDCTHDLKGQTVPIPPYEGH